MPRLPIHQDFLDFTDSVSCMIYIFQVNCYYHVVFCTSDIYCMSVRPRKKDPSSVVLPEVSYFPCFGFFKCFSHQV